MSRFTVAYTIGVSDQAEAKSIAEALAVEQTIEFPPDLVRDDFISNQVKGRVEDLVGEGTHFLAKISYDEACTAMEDVSCTKDC